MTIKAAVRADILASRQALSPTASAYKSSAIAQRVCAEPWFKQARTIGLYAAHKGEVNPAPIFEEAYARGKVTGYPRVEDAGLVFVEVDDLDDLAPGAFGILEPPPGLRGDSIAPEQFDVLFVPGIVFDVAGHRVGFGHGYYDRFLPRARPDAVRVGLAFECQLIPAAPHAAHDVAMHKIITEETVYECVSTDSHTLKG